MRFAICNEIFQGWDIDAVFDDCKKIGYDGVELAPFTLAPALHEISPAIRRRVRMAAARSGLAVCGLHWLLAKTEGLCLTSPEAEIRRRTSQYFCDLVDCCVELGGKILVLGSPRQRNVPAGMTRQLAWQFAADTLSAAVKRAEMHRATICLEPLSPKETNFINTAHEAIAFAEQFRSPAVKIILDVKAMCAESIPIPQIIQASAGHFAHFHANDQNLKGPGFGDTDFRPIAAALRATGYDGFVSVEVFNFDDGADVIARKSFEYLRESFRQAPSTL